MSDPNNLLKYLLPPIVAPRVCPSVTLDNVPVFIETRVAPYYGVPTLIVYDYAGYGFLTKNIPGPYQGIFFNNYGNT